MIDLLFSNITSGISSFLKTTVIVVGLFEGSHHLEDNGVFSKQNDKILKTINNVGSFNGKFAEFLPISNLDQEGSMVLLVGLGDNKDWNEHQALKLGGKIFSELERMNVKNASIIANYDDSISANIAYGAFLRSFKFNKYFVDKKDDHAAKTQKINILVNNKSDKVENIFKNLKAEGDGVFLARSLVSEPANVLYPETYAQKISDELKDLNVEIEVFDEDYMKKQGMWALLGVGQGSSKRSKLVVMKWNGSSKKNNSIAFVGKGVTFDTGGISIKPSKGMWDMKYDMAGSAAVVGVMKSLAIRKAKVNAVGVVGLVENAVDGNAQRPGDVVTSMSGQTIEVLNTDAEGRLVLADALWYTQKMYSPKLMVDLATLTGAIVVALGSNQYAGIFSNNNEIANQLVTSGKDADEKVWQFPLDQGYDKMIDSSIADMQNISTKGSGADSITAAQFLQRFVNDLPWVHIDIAGMAWHNEGNEICPKGATGFGVRLLNKFVAKYYEDKN